MTVPSSPGGRCVIFSKVITMLGMSGDPVVVRAVQEAVAKYGQQRFGRAGWFRARKTSIAIWKHAIAQFIGVEELWRS